jgi:hypothetical protein
VRDLADLLAERAHAAAQAADGSASGWRTPSQAVVGLIDAYADRDWSRLKDIYHPHALMTTHAGGMEPRTPAEMVAAIREASAGIFQFKVTSLIDLDERTCLASGRIRHRVAEGGFADHESHWLYVFKGGRLWRSSVYPSSRAARAAYAEHGHSLGIEAPEYQKA